MIRQPRHAKIKLMMLVEVVCQFLLLVMTIINECGQTENQQSCNIGLFVTKLSVVLDSRHMPQHHDDHRNKHFKIKLGK